MLDLSTLNHAQLEAVVTTEGPLLVLAGAGSGKTRVITYRLAHLLERGVNARNILCVTFTNKAANEMQARAKKLAGRGVRGATLSTFHALGAKILRTYGTHAGLKSNFAICDGSEQIGTVRRILRDLRIDDRKFDAKALLAQISRIKNAGVDGAQYRALEGEVEGVEPLPDEAYTEACIETYERYESGLRVQNVVDFDDLLLLTLNLLRNDEEVRTKLQKKWRYAMIDEYQDTNGAQLEIMRLLAGTTRNICVVGDDDQSIYGWRGANIRNILDFEQHFPGARRVTLDINYRSTGHILTVANFIIAKNPDRFEKTLRPAAGEGAPVKIVALEDEEAEAEEVAKTILSLIARQAPASEIAVLFRSNVQSRPIELALRRAHIPYRVVGGIDLFDKKEVKDALAYLRVLDNGDDEQSLRRIINFPPRGISDATVERVDAWAREEGLAWVQGLGRIHDIPQIPAKAQDAVAVFLKLLEDHRKLLKRQKASTVAKKLMAATKLEEVLFNSSDNAVSAERRVDNVREILRQLDRFEQLKKSAKKARAEGRDRPEAEVDDLDPGLDPRLDPEPDLDLDTDLDLHVDPRAGADSELSPELDLELEQQLEHAEDQVGLLGAFLNELTMGAWSDEHQSKVERSDQVVLSTIHAAKGLEWTYVFLVGCEEELLPHRRTLTEGIGLDEERRLAYVAVTRAQRFLTMSYARTRTKWGRLENRLRSRFLTELPEGSVTWVEGEMKEEGSADEQDAVRKHWVAKIRAQLGLKEDSAEAKMLEKASSQSPGSR
ncbi:MAG: UvrD-helicase domain-containing protein [Deltaproteobacteria bacterium]|nr:UvrD-helicase domain-containing protein [Deltaproteobacteria bacterium]